LAVRIYDLVVLFNGAATSADQKLMAVDIKGAGNAIQPAASKVLFRVRKGNDGGMGFAAT
jgi:hypothetical protein